MSDPAEVKTKMLKRGFMPSDAAPEYRIANALEFIALYLERIDQELDRISPAIDLISSKLR